MDKPKILIEAFENASNNAADDFVKIGLRESIITSLSNYSQIEVQSSNISEFVAKNELNNEKIANDYGIIYKVSGAYQIYGNQMRINVELSNIQNNSIVWSKKFDFDKANMFEVQDKLSRSILEELGATLTMGNQAKHWSSYLETLEQY